MRRMMTFGRWNIACRLAVGALGIHLQSVAGNLSAGNATEVDQLFAQWDRADSPGAAVVVVKDGAVSINTATGAPISSIASR
jgi:hypothetical protein